MARYNTVGIDSDAPWSFTTRSQSAQTITFGALSNIRLGVAPLAISATASSGLPVSFASNTTSVCMPSGDTVTILAVGTCSITASQVGSTNYAAAIPITQSFTVSSGMAASVIYSNITGPPLVVGFAEAVEGNTFGPESFVAGLFRLQTLP